MITPLRDRLKQPGVILADGAIGTILLQKVLKPGDCPEQISLDSPEILEEIAGSYFKAGAEILQTNTFGGSPLKLSLFNLEDKTEEINTQAIRCVKKAVQNRAYIAASCGPCGKILEPYGDTSPELVYESFKKQMAVIIGQGVDLICIETMTDIAESYLAVKAAKSVSPTILVCATMTFDSTPRGFRTNMGVSIGQAVENLTDAGAEIIGSNCGNGITNMVKIAKEFMEFTSLPIIIRPNAGLPIFKHGSSTYPETPEFMAQESKNLISLGVKIIGGCCGTTPEHIAAIKKIVIESYPKQLQ